jgi:ribosomal protein S18 acetylase RimI-like enzyme
MDEVTYQVSYRATVSEVSAWVGRRKVGYLLWATGGSYPEFYGEIQEVAVAKDMRRNKIASNMLARARQEDPRLHHSPSRTRLGHAWAISVRVDGERLPPWSPKPDFDVNL